MYVLIEINLIDGSSYPIGCTLRKEIAEKVKNELNKKDDNYYIYISSDISIFE